MDDLGARMQRVATECAESACVYCDSCAYWDDRRSQIESTAKPKDVPR